MEQNKNDRCCISLSIFSQSNISKTSASVSLVSQHEKKRWMYETAGRVVVLFHFRVFGTSIKPEVRVFEITSPTIKYRTGFDPRNMADTLRTSS